MRLAASILAIGSLALAVAAYIFISHGHTSDGDEAALLGLINQYRSQNGLGSLSVNDRLTAAAEWMSQDMCAKNYFSHTDSLGRDPFTRMADFGYTFNTWKGENLAAGTDTAAATFEIWRSSPGHNTIMLDDKFVVVGIARARGCAGYSSYWTADFGGLLPEMPAPPPSAPPPPPPPPEPPPPEPVPEPTPTLTPEPTPVPTPLVTLTAIPSPPPAPAPPEQPSGPLWNRAYELGRDAVRWVGDRISSLLP